jgi:molecular chaperone HtpG
MYPDAKIIYREYIQNSRDAINDAVNQGILSSTTEGRISVNIDSQNRKITIQDNGTGVAANDVEDVLLDIAASTKDGETSAGQFGIGRLVGGGYCKTLSFETSYKGETFVSLITFDIDAAYNILKDTTDNRSATDVIDAITKISTLQKHKNGADIDVNEHYFIVTLENVKYDILLDTNAITEYLKDVAPIDFNAVFTNAFIPSATPADYIDLQKKVGCFQLSVNGENIEKRYKKKVVGSGDEINDLVYFKIQDDKYGLLAWGWYALTKFSIEIPESDPNRCIRLRKHNILIGTPDFLNQFFKEPRSNNYFYGEIHAVHLKLRPEGSRSGLAPTPEAMRFQELLSEYFYTLYQLYHLASNLKTSTRDIKESAQQLALTPNQEDLPGVTEKWEKANKKLATTENKVIAKTEEGQKLVELYKKQVKDIFKNPPATIPQANSKPEVSSVVTQTPPPDQLEPLKTKYSTDKIDLIRKIFKIFTDKCRSQDQRPVKELIKLAIKELSSNGTN